MSKSFFQRTQRYWIPATLVSLRSWHRRDRRNLCQNHRELVKHIAVPDDAVAIFYDPSMKLILVDSGDDPPSHHVHRSREAGGRRFRRANGKPGVRRVLYLEKSGCRL